GGVLAGKPTKENWLRKVTPRHPNHSMQRSGRPLRCISAVVAGHKNLQGHRSSGHRQLVARGSKMRYEKKALDFS
ncbi:MAG: hypothetical protein WCJ75_15995, partial [Desulfomonile sp.]